MDGQTDGGAKQIVYTQLRLSRGHTQELISRRLRGINYDVQINNGQFASRSNDPGSGSFASGCGADAASGVAAGGFIRTRSFNQPEEPLDSAQQGATRRLQRPPITQPVLEKRKKGARIKRNLSFLRLQNQIFCSEGRKDGAEDVFT